MTKRQKEFYDFIRIYWQIHGQSPTYRIIASGMNARVSFAHRTVQRLKEQGWLRVTFHKYPATIIPMIPKI